MTEYYGLTSNTMLHKNFRAVVDAHEDYNIVPISSEIHSGGRWRTADSRCLFKSVKVSKSERSNLAKELRSYGLNRNAVNERMGNTNPADQTMIYDWGIVLPYDVVIIEGAKYGGSRGCLAKQRSYIFCVATRKDAAASTKEGDDE